MASAGTVDLVVPEMETRKASLVSRGWWEALRHRPMLVHDPRVRCPVYSAARAASFLWCRRGGRGGPRWRDAVFPPRPAAMPTNNWAGWRLDPVLESLADTVWRALPDTAGEPPIRVPALSRYSSRIRPRAQRRYTLFWLLHDARLDQIPTCRVVEGRRCPLPRREIRQRLVRLLTTDYHPPARMYRGPGGRPII